MENVDPFMGILVPYINFAIFIGAAIYFFRKPARAAAEKKREQFELERAEAQKAKLDAEQALFQLESRLGSIQAEIEDIRHTAKRGAEMEAERIVASARELAGHLQQEAERIAANEVEKARQSLRDEVIAQVKSSVTQRLRNDLSEGDQSRLVESRIGKLKEVTAVH